ncbi:MAG TPA: pectin acetylesterase-family hydrolase [Kofleriaceae bacterium]
MRLFAIAVVLAACHGDDAPSIPGEAAVEYPPPDPDAGIPNTPNQWVWVPVDGTTCANGTPAGFGINRAAAAGGNLFVYFEGGGACWDTATCTANPPLAVNLDVTYDQAHLATDTAGLVPNRTAGQPLATTTYIFVPYCTADLHAGTNVMAYPGGPTIHHTGATNTQKFVDLIAKEFPAPPTVWVIGSSAGGYGATLDFHRFAQHWSNVHLMEDSSPFIPFVAAYDKLTTAWKIAFPPNCTGCETSFTAVFDAVVADNPNSRIGLMTWDDDAVIKQYFGYTSSLAPIQDDLITNHFAHPNTKVFEATGTNHTMFGTLNVTSHGVVAGTWLTQWLLGDAAWATVRP